VFAKKSYHTLGMAVDLRLPGRQTERPAGYAVGLPGKKKVGVGTIQSPILFTLTPLVFANGNSGGLLIFVSS